MSLDNAQLVDLISQLPNDYMEVASREMQANVCAHGYIRLYGNDTGLNILSWNEADVWRFAWEKFGIENLLFFGGDAFGEQYAFVVDGEKLTGKVKMFSHLDFQELVEFSSFEKFYENYYLKSSQVIQDDYLRLAYQKFGKLPSEIQLIQTPSELLTGQFDKNLLSKISSVDAMVANGDIASQILFLDEELFVKGVESYIDNRGRTRVRLLTAKV